MQPDYIAPLPESAQVIADIIGREMTLHLAKHLKYDNLYHSRRGQCRLLYIPKLKKMTDDYWLVKVIGVDNAEKLQKEFGGCLITLASCHETLTGERNNKICNGYKAGKSINELSSLFGLSTRSIYYIVTNTRITDTGNK
jgi:hypothetical protein